MEPKERSRIHPLIALFLTALQLDGHRRKVGASDMTLAPTMEYRNTIDANALGLHLNPNRNPAQVVVIWRGGAAK
jgi:hypothetical protein